MELTKNEIDIINRFSNALLNSIDIESKMRTNDTKDGYYPYIPNTDIASIVKVMLKYKLNSLADLGCGEAHILHMLSLLHFKVMGVEIDLSYIQNAKKLLNSTIHIIHKDIFDLKPNEIKYRNPAWEYQRAMKQWEYPDALYFYEPIFKRDIAFDFIDKIMQLVRPGQYILHKDANSNMKERLAIYVEKNQLILMEKTGLWVYRKLKKKRFGNQKFKLIV